MVSFDKQAFIRDYVEILSLCHEANDQMREGRNKLKTLEMKHGKKIRYWADRFGWDSDIFTYQQSYDDMLEDSMRVEQIAFLAMNRVDLETGRLPSEEIH